MSRPKIIFLATEDWFVTSHFRPLLRRALSDGFEVIVAACDSGALKSEPGIRVAPMPFARRGLTPAEVWREAGAVRALLRQEQPAIVHAIALKPIALTVLAGVARMTPCVLALTGRGYLEARGGWRRMVLDAVAGRMRSSIARGRALLLTENRADQDWVRGSAHLPASRMLLMPGAGVDPAQYTLAPEPGGPIVIGLAARLVRSKGIDIAVAAVEQLRSQGMDVELRVAGAVDPENPEHVGDAEIAIWRATQGVTLLGRVQDINAFWAATHIACLPSRGGEGLPRSLLEAGACGRPLVTTNTPGCADFVIDGETGFVVVRDDVSATADALAKLVRDEALRKRFGAAARARVLAAYTEIHTADVASEAWRRCLADSAPESAPGD